MPSHDSSGISASRDRTIGALEAAHETLLWLAEDVPLRAFRGRGGPEDLAWILTHLGAYYAFVVANVGGRAPRLPTIYRRAHPTMFESPSRARRGVSDVVTPERIRADLACAFASLVAAGHAMTPKDLRSTPRGGMRDYAPDRLACLERAVWHEGWHSAHISAIRRRKGLPLRF